MDSVKKVPVKTVLFSQSKASENLGAKLIITSSLKQLQEKG